MVSAHRAQQALLGGTCLGCLVGLGALVWDSSGEKGLRAQGGQLPGGPPACAPTL